MAIRIEILPPRYQDVVHIARGGMGDVYRATDTTLGRTVAVKLLAERYADDESVRRRFKNESLAAARLSAAPFTVTIFDVSESEEQPFIVMEFLEGGSLEQRLRSGRPETGDVLRWLDQAAQALDAGHAAGVVHRDVKPGNLLLDGRGDVHVADFGVASAVGLDSMTMTGTVLGTAGYLSPEQAQGQRATPASDRYALAVVAWELFTGRRPFESNSPTAEAVAHVKSPVPSISGATDLPRELDPVFERALAKEPDARYPSAADFVTDLRNTLRSEAGETRPITTPTQAPPGRDGRGWRVIAVLAGAAVALLAGGIAVAGLVGGDDQPQTRTITKEGTTATTNVTTTTPAPQPPTPPPPASASGTQLTDQATALLNQGRWVEAERIARQAVQKLAGSGPPYEAYANYDLGRALAEQGKCAEALQHLNRSEQLQGHRTQIDDARARCR